MSQPPPIHSPVIDGNDLMTKIWLGFLQDLQTLSGSVSIGAGDVGTTELAALAVTLAKLAAVIIQLTGTRAAPTNVTAAGGITPAGKWFEAIFCQGSGGAIDITANPQIAAGTVGQLLLLIGRSSTNTLKFDDGTGLALNGSMTLEADDTLLLFCDGTNWVEITRKDAA